MAARQKARAIPGKVRSGFPSGIAARQKASAIPGKVRSGFPSGIAATLLAALLAFAAPAHAGEVPAVRIGINRMNLAWLPRSEQEKVLKDIAMSGATDIRLSLSRPVDKSIEALAIAHRLGLRILLEIQLGNKSYYPQSAGPRTGHGRIWDVYRLSDLDLARYRRELRDALRRIGALGIRLEAIEPGNEINYAGYNGDLAVFRKPGTRTPRSLGELQDRAGFERGLDNYVQAVAITRSEVRRTTHSRDAAVISAGLSDMSAAEADRRGMERLDPHQLVSLLRERGIDDLVDAYGIHIYPGRKAAPAIAARVRSLLEFCQPAATGRSCWVTEWGIANTARSCPVDDRSRGKAIGATRAAFGEFTEAGRLTAAYYYDWDSEPSYSLWRCGNLSPDAATALSPLEPAGARAR
ncbi:glycoside hydrolase [Sinorhizobium medicae]|nr:glycoside hydrolase [Sinorhizobium medicae]